LGFGFFSGSAGGTADQLTGGAWRLGLRGGLPRRDGRDATREPLVGTLVVVDVVEGVDLGLQLGQSGGERLLVEVAEQVLVEASFLPWVVGL
jgi:hypothetical protein